MSTNRIQVAPEAERLTFAERTNLGILAFEKTTRGTFVLKDLNKFGSFGAAGLASGDEILAINDLPAPTTEEAWTLYMQAGHGGQVKLQVNRMGTVFELPVTIKKRRLMDLDLDEVGVDLERKIAP